MNYLDEQRSLVPPCQDPPTRRHRLRTDKDYAAFTNMLVSLSQNTKMGMFLQLIEISLCFHHESSLLRRTANFNLIHAKNLFSFEIEEEFNKITAY